jgi:hypothetical protein
LLRSKLYSEVLTQRNTLTNTNKNTTSDKARKVVAGGKCLQECSNNNQDTTRSHSDLTAGIVGYGTTAEETSEDSTDGIRSIDGSD